MVVVGAAQPEEGKNYSKGVFRKIDYAVALQLYQTHAHLL